MQAHQNGCWHPQAHLHLAMPAKRAVHLATIPGNCLSLSISQPPGPKRLQGASAQGLQEAAGMGQMAEDSLWRTQFLEAQAPQAVGSKFVVAAHQVVAAEVTGMQGWDPCTVRGRL